MKALRNIAAVCVLATVSRVAVAVPMEYKFDVDFSTGYFLAGTTAPVYVTLDGVRGTGSEVFRQNTGNLLAFRFKFQGFSFDLRDVVDYRPLPKIALQDGKLVSVIGTFEFAMFFATFNFTPQVNQVRYQDRYFGDGRGKVNAASWPTPVNPVPAPTTLALFGLGLAGLSLHRRKRANSSAL